MKFTVLLSALVLSMIAPPAEALYGGLFEFLFGSLETTYTFVAVLSVSQETPTCAQTTGMGNALATYDSKTMKFCYNLSYTGLSQAVENASHIHAPGAIGATGPVLFTLPTGANKVGCVTLTAQTDEDSLLNELWYFNIHTTACASGELRGQILVV